MRQTIVFDLSNIAYICAHRSSNNFGENISASEYLLQQMEVFMRGIYRNFKQKPSVNNVDIDYRVIFACDSDDNTYWRNSLFSDYKQNRPMTQLRQTVRDSIVLFLKKHPKLSIMIKGCEADDVISVLAQVLPDNLDPDLKSDLVIVSTDRDFMQLISPKVRLYNPKDKRFRARKDSAEYEVFIKSIRGDSADNIPSAYPYVTTKKLNKAFADKALQEKLMDVILDNSSKVGDLYQRNRKLIDLKLLPDDLYDKIYVRVMEFFTVTVDI